MTMEELATRLRHPAYRGTRLIVEVSADDGSLSVERVMTE